MAGRKAEKETRDKLFEEASHLQKAAMSGDPIPMPQRTAMRGQAAALFEQWIELEAARFNTSAQDYNKAIGGMKAALADLQAEIDALEDAIKIVEQATVVVRAGDALLKVAIQHLPI